MASVFFCVQSHRSKGYTLHWLHLLHQIERDSSLTCHTGFLSEADVRLYPRLSLHLIWIWNEWKSACYYMIRCLWFVLCKSKRHPERLRLTVWLQEHCETRALSDWPGFCGRYVNCTDSLSIWSEMRRRRTSTSTSPGMSWSWYGGVLNTMAICRCTSVWANSPFAFHDPFLKRISMSSVNQKPHRAQC